MKFLPMLLVASLLTGCSSFGRLTDVTNLVNYSNHKSVKVLEIPADLDAPGFDKTYITTVSDKMGATKSARLDRVPLVDAAMGKPAASSVKVVRKGAQNIMQIKGAPSTVWASLNQALKKMGMTVAKSDQASGLISARDKSLIAGSASPIGRLLNRSLGRVNKGAQYQFRVTGNDQQTTVEVADKTGKVLPVADAQVILGRLRKEYKN